MRAEQINQVSRIGFWALALGASLTVFQAVVRAAIRGQIPPPAADEGTEAHIFQLCLAGLLPIGLVFLASMDWSQPWRSMRRLVLPAIALFVAIGILIYVEQVYYPAHYPPVR